MSFHRSSSRVLAVLACLQLLACADDSSPMDPLDLGGFAGTAAGTGSDLPQAGQAGGAGTFSPGPDLDGDDAGQDFDAALAADGSADAGMQDAEAAADAAVEAPKPRCVTKGSQVVVLGDSYINWVSHTFPTDLNKEAGQTYRMYAVGGYSMGSGGAGLIPPQLDEAVAADSDIRAIVMTGGGNDVLVADTVQFPKGGDCKMSMMSPSITDCQKIVDKALDAADEMLNNGVAHGIRDVVYFFYPKVPEGTLVGGAYPNAILEYAYPLVQDFCDSTFERTGGKATCHFIDMRPVFQDHPEYFVLTDIHPNATGSAAMAKAVWQKMKDKCVGQPASSGCCEP